MSGIIGGAGSKSGVIGAIPKNHISAITWRMLNHESTGAPDPIGGGGSDWEIADDTKMEYYLGESTQITESSGYFSFGSTGYWLILGSSSAVTDGGTVEAMYFELQATTNNSAYSNIAVAIGGSMFAQGAMSSMSLNTIVKVTDIANHKVKLKGQSITGADGYFLGSSADNKTALTFIKLGEI